MSAPQDEFIKTMLNNYLSHTEHPLPMDEKDPDQIKKRLKIIRGLSYPPIVKSLH